MLDFFTTSEYCRGENSRIKVPRYHNAVLKDMNDRKDRAAAIMNRFFMTELSDEERWDVIEDYFLGDMSAVYHALDIEE